MIRPILKMGDPRLLRVAQPVADVHDPALRAIIADMYDTMHDAKGVGLAAPQIGVDLRLMIFGFDANPRYPEALPVPATALINPWFQVLGEGEEEGWEGCLSVPGMRGLVPRFTRLRYQGFDAAGAPIDRTVEGFHARVVQHEVDHLDGILFPQRVRDLRDFGFEDALAGQMTPMPD